MAGTNTSIKAETNKLQAPVIILVHPQLGENIGMCARAMLNCGVTELRLVKPRDGWPNTKADSASAGAVQVIENAKVFETTKEAIADLEFVLATTARARDMVKDVYSTNEAAQKIHQVSNAENKCGILFGPERTGLENDDVALANATLNIPLNPSFSSLNLAQAVLLTCFSWLSADNHFEQKKNEEENKPAKKEDVEFLLKHLEDELDKAKFFRSLEQKPNTIRNIRNFFFRSSPTDQETKTFHGIISALTGKRSWK